MNEPLDAAPGISLNQPQQVEQDEQVGGNEADADQVEVPDKLKELPWQKCRSEDQGDVLGPDFFKCKSNAFYEINCCIEKDAQAEHAEVAGADESSPGEDVVDRAAVWVEAKACDDPMVEEADEVAVDELRRSCGNDEKEYALQNLQAADEH